KPSHAHGDGMAAKAPKAKDVVEHKPKEPPALQLKEGIAKSRTVHFLPSPPIKLPSPPGSSTQNGSSPKVDLATLVLQTERELAVLLVLKNQQIIRSTEEAMQMLAREDQAVLLKKLNDPDPATRTLAALVIGQKRLHLAGDLLPLLSDP